MNVSLMVLSYWGMVAFCDKVVLILLVNAVYEGIADEVLVTTEG